MERPPNANKWGVMNLPEGFNLELEYEPGSVLENSNIVDKMTQAYVSEGVYSSGSYRSGPFVHPKDLCRLINLASYHIRQRSDHINETLDVAYDETARLANGLDEVRQRLDTMTNGTKGHNFQELARRFSELNSELSRLEDKKMKMDQQFQELGEKANTQNQQISELQEALEVEKARHRQAKDNHIVLQSDLVILQSQFDDLRAQHDVLVDGHEQHTEELRKKCECVLQ